MQCLIQASRHFETWVRQRALPLWANVGFNAGQQMSYERLLCTGEPDLDANTRVRVQARQSFVYSVAHYMGWIDDARKTAESMLSSIDKVAKHPTAANGYTHLLSKDLEIIDSKQDLYDHTFFILAHLWSYRAFGAQSALDKARSLLEYLDARFASEYGGWIEGDYAYEYRRQNPHMHMFEALLVGYDATGDDYWLMRATEMFNLFKQHFYDHNYKAIREYFSEDWSSVPGDKGKIVEPGHMMEWVWLLRWYGSRSGENVSEYANNLYAKALEIGQCSRSGLLLDEVHLSGRTIKATKRCWPMTEYIKASVAQARVGEKSAERNATSAIELLFKYYIDPALTPGAYVDQLDEHNQIIVATAPASSLYHLITAATEVADFCRRHTKSSGTFDRRCRPGLDEKGQAVKLNI